MEINIIVGLYGTGKTTILDNMNNLEFEKLSLDTLDKNSRTDEKRIIIIFNLFKNFIKNNDIDFQTFYDDYLNIFSTQNKSLINTLSVLFSKYSFGNLNETMKNELRKNIMVPSILNNFLIKLEKQNCTKNLVVDSGAMHFLSMDKSFFKNLSKFYKKINIIYLNNSIEKVISNLFKINNEHYSFLERGFKKEIFTSIKNDLGIILPNDYKEATDFIEKNEECKIYIRKYINNILSSSQKELDIFLENIKKYKDKIELYTININKDDTISNIIHKFNLELFKKKINNKIIKKKPVAIFFDLSSTILDSHKIDLECIDSVLIKYGLPKWLEGTNKKKDKNKSMKLNFPNFFGEENSDKAYQKYFNLLLNNIHRMPLINGIEETLIYCNKNNIKCVIVSNRDKSFVEKFLEVFKFNKYFDEIITPETTGYTKPNPKIVLPYIEKLNINNNNETILFLGDSFVDIKCNYNSGYVPILYTEIQRDEISNKNLERLSQLNPDNPIIIINNQKEFINLLEISKEYYIKKEIIKITFIGANGKIGKQALNMICASIPQKENVEMVFIGSGSQESLIRLNGLIKDLSGALELNDIKANIKFTITNDYKNTINSKLVICTAGKWPTKEEKEQFQLIDESGRLIQSKINSKLIEDITSQLNEYCSNVVFLIVTNQVDMMCHIARQIGKNMNIMGLTGGVDSARLKQSIKNILGIESTGYMIGYHNESMIPIIKSLKTKSENKLIFPLISKEIEFTEDKDLQKYFKEMEKEKLQKIVSSTRTIGGLISKEQKTGLNTDIDTGASILPATAISRFINSICFDIPHIESYNTLITDPIIAKHYGVQSNTELSIPLRISKDKIEQLNDIELSQFEKNAMKEAQQKLKEGLKKLFSDK